MKIFTKDYDYESTYDLGQDVEEALNPDYNPVVNKIPKDEYNYLKGTFTVTITWENKEYNETLDAPSSI